MLVWGSKIANLIDKYRTIFPGKWRKPWNFQKTMSVFWSSLWICFEVYKKILIESSEPCSIGSRLYNTKFEQPIQNLGKGGKNSNFAKNLLHVGVCCKPVLKVAKSLNQTFWATECWYKAQKCKILSTNTKLFFRWSEANLKTSWQLSPYIGVSYKFVLKSLFWKHKSNPLNHGSLFQGFIIPNLVNKYQTIFSWKRGWPWNSLERKVSSHIGVVYKFVFESAKSLG